MVLQENFSSGIQQGSALGPELFNVVRNDPKKRQLVREQDLWYIITQNTEDKTQQTAERHNINEQFNKTVNEI